MHSIFFLMWKMLAFIIFKKRLESFWKRINAVCCEPFNKIQRRDYNSNGRLDSYNKVSERQLRHMPRRLGTVYHSCPPIWRAGTPSMRAGVSVCRPSYGAFGISLRAIRRTLVVFETPSKILASSNAGKLRRSKLSIMPYSIVSIPSRWRRELEV